MESTPLDSESLRKIAISIQHTDNIDKFQILQNAVLQYCFEQDRLHTDYFSTLALIPLYHILSYLSALDLARLSQTCTSLKHVCEDDKLWKRKAKAQVLMYGLVNSVFWYNTRFEDSPMSPADYYDFANFDSDNFGSVYFGERGPWKGGGNLMYTMDYFVEQCAKICPYLTWKWWYGKLIISFCGSEKADVLALRDVDAELKKDPTDLLQCLKSKNSAENDKALLDWIRCYRAAYLYRRRSQTTSEGSERIFVGKNLRGDNMFNFLFKLDSFESDSEFDYLWCSQSTMLAVFMNTQRMNKNSPNQKKTIVSGCLVGTGFTWVGIDLSFSTLGVITNFGKGNLGFITNFGKGKITFDDSFEVDTKHLDAYAPFMLGTHTCFMNTDMNITHALNHPLVLATLQCFDDFKCYPQQFFEEDNKFYCVSCYSAKCHLKSEKKEIETINNDVSSIWIYHKDDQVRCACDSNKNKCKLRNQFV